jgi:23S rRNA (adenine2030-N6)-methyltransferase
VNYHHAYHAGNFADVLKHLVLARILQHLARKETPFRAIDTHAGIGLYQLTAEEAEKTGEWRDGIGRLDTAFAPEVEALLEPYRDVVEAVRRRHGPEAYPGSPAIIREMLRPQDRGVLVELHPEDARVLSDRFNTVTNLKVMELDGWTALRALIPPKEKRGVVLIDPPFEETGELARMTREILKSLAKWPGGVFCAWYPIKDMRDVDAAAAELASACPRPGLRIELVIDRPDVPDRLNGCGLFVVNPPWTLRSEAEILLPALASRLSRSGYGAFRCEPFGRDG